MRERVGGARLACGLRYVLYPIGFGDYVHGLLWRLEYLHSFQRP